MQYPFLISRVAINSHLKKIRAFIQTVEMALLGPFLHILRVVERQPVALKQHHYPGFSRFVIKYFWVAGIIAVDLVVTINNGVAFVTFKSLTAICAVSDTLHLLTARYRVKSGIIKYQGVFTPAAIIVLIN